ncbi:MAG: class D sortase [Acidobacteriaceae bacterium]|nr:class D sortase [Acidobacteriaceae bacterium]
MRIDLMANVTGPVIIRPAGGPYGWRPGEHSHNVRRRVGADQRQKRQGTFRHLRRILFLAGICALGYYGYTFGDEYVYQAYENWAFDQQISGNKTVTFADFIRAAMPFGSLLGGGTALPPDVAASRPPSPAPQAPRPVYGSILGRVEISRLHLSAMVREGVDARVLSLAVGHVPSTALPGQQGNFAIAAHRDTLFRALKDIRTGDLVTFQNSLGAYTYRVLATKIVRPSDVSVLRSDGGGLIPVAEIANEPKLLTMITCYPFYYVGSAPKRFIVEAKLVSNNPSGQEKLAATKRDRRSAPAPRRFS